MSAVAAPTDCASGAAPDARSTVSLMDVSLVMLAAGLGSRFKGTKQLAEVGPDGETILDFTIGDAVAAGASRVVMIVRSDIEDDVRAHVEPRHPDVELAWARQDDHGPHRDKPWGTAHAVLSAAEAITGPFVVANADDYYGPTAVGALVREAAELPDDRVLLSGFELGRTLPAAGAVSRGICSVDDDELVSITETHGVERTPDGIRATDPPGELADDAIASMNLWAFPHAFLEHLDRGFVTFLDEHGDEEKTEYLLPSYVDELKEAGELSVGVVRTDEEWTGITNPDDLETARARIAEIRA